MSEAEYLVLPINDGELVSSLGAFREEVTQIFQAKDSAYCKEVNGWEGIGLRAEYREPDHDLCVPFVFRGIGLGAAVIDKDSQISSIPSGNLITVMAETADIHGPMRNDGVTRNRNFCLAFSRYGQEGNVSLSASYRHTTEEKRRDSGEAYETERGSNRVVTIRNKSDLAQRLGWAVHLVDVYVNPEKHPDSQLLT